jgi:hypothetical protein
LDYTKDGAKRQQKRLQELHFLVEEMTTWVLFGIPPLEIYIVVSPPNLDDFPYQSDETPKVSTAYLLCKAGKPIHHTILHIEKIGVPRLQSISAYYH